MKIAGLVLAFALAVSSFAAPKVSPVAAQSDSAQEQQAAHDQEAWNEFTKFAADHGLFGAYRGGSGMPWDLAFFTEDANGQPTGDGPKWAVYGYADLAEAVKQIESDYTQYPNGHNNPPAATAPKANV